MVFVEAVGRAGWCGWGRAVSAMMGGRMGLPGFLRGRPSVLGGGGSVINSGIVNMYKTQALNGIYILLSNGSVFEVLFYNYGFINFVLV